MISDSHPPCREHADVTNGTIEILQFGPVWQILEQERILERLRWESGDIWRCFPGKKSRSPSKWLSFMVNLSLDSSKRLKADPAHQATYLLTRYAQTKELLMPVVGIVSSCEGNRVAKGWSFEVVGSISSNSC